MSRQNKKKTRILILFIFLAFIIGFLYFQSQKQDKGCAQPERNFDENAYIQKIIKDRETKDLDFADSSKSRFNAEERASFKGLNYFDVAPCYRLAVTFTVDTSTAVFKMPTNTTRKPNYRVYGYIDFKVVDTVCRLTAYQNMDIRNHPDYGGYLFVPFSDNTNGRESYGAGRYLDIPIPSEKSFILDFNEAYNPYCAYSDRWSCPLVPFENYLELAIPAGEMKYKEKVKPGH